MVAEMNPSDPGGTAELQSVFGGPSSSGFGSAVFVESVAADGDLEKAALGVYRRFVGQLWERWGEAAWMGPWKQAFARTSPGRGDIVAELRSVSDPVVSSAAGMLLDAGQDPAAARSALAGAFDLVDVGDLRIFTIGDGEAMSGLLIAGRRERGDATFLAFLMD
jgi:hypothetical protein